MITELWEGRGLDAIVAGVKTISRREADLLYDVIETVQPKRIIEFGTQRGCSARIMWEVCRFLDLSTQIITYDLADEVRREILGCTDVECRRGDLTYNVSALFDTERPDIVYLDAHARRLVFHVIAASSERRIPLVCHDVSPRLYRENAVRGWANDLCHWEMWHLVYVLGLPIEEVDSQEREFAIAGGTARVLADRFGLAVITWGGK